MWEILRNYRKFNKGSWYRRLKKAIRITRGGKMKQEIVEGLWTAFGVGVILSLIVNIFIVWGGRPRGMFWRIDDNKKALQKALQGVNKRMDELEKENGFQVICDEALMRGIGDLRERVQWLENNRWYGKAER